MNPNAWKRLSWIVAALVLAVTIFAPSLADPGRLTASVDEAFEVDGRVYPAGRLTVKSVRAYNPSVVLGEIWVGGDCLGLFRATKVAPGSSATSDALSFERSAAGRLALVGFSASARPVPGVYRFESPARGSSGTPELARR